MTSVDGQLFRMAEMEQVQGVLSVHILLPEVVERRLERWTEEMPGASWPAWGGHITLVPNFVPRGTLEEVLETLEKSCAPRQPFQVRFAAPISVKDTTRPDYCAVFLTVEDLVEEQQPLHDLREAILAALEPLREDAHPELLEKPFLPHVTLALGLGESESLALVRAMRAEPMEAEFLVDAVWLLRHNQGAEKRHERYALPLGGVARAELMRD